MDPGNVPHFSPVLFYSHWRFTRLYIILCAHISVEIENEWLLGFGDITSHEYSAWVQIFKPKRVKQIFAWLGVSDAKFATTPVFGLFLYVNLTRRIFFFAFSVKRSISSKSPALSNVPLNICILRRGPGDCRPAAWGSTPGLGEIQQGILSHRHRPSFLISGWGQVLFLRGRI